VTGLVVFRGLRNGERAANYKAKHDALTGLWNRAGCLEILEVSLNSDTGRLTALDILDLDGFKPVNDAWGHPVGDELLRQWVQVFSQICHPRLSWHVWAGTNSLLSTNPPLQKPI